MRSEAERLAERVTNLERLVLALAQNVRVFELANALRVVDPDVDLFEMIHQIGLDMERSKETGQV